jgi:hypothetical protein
MVPLLHKWKSSSIFHAMVGWGVRIVWGVIVALFALVYFHIIPEFIHKPSDYLMIVVTILLFLSEILNEWRREMFARQQKQTAMLESIQQGMRGDSQLLSLEESLDDLKERLKKVDPGQKVVIEHFGLDMTFAWEPVDELIKELSNLTDLEYRLLMLAARDVNDPSEFDDDIKRWLITGRTHSDKIRKELASLQSACQKLNRKFAFDMRTYATIPFVHGLRVTEPFHAAYIALCRWDHDNLSKFRWGRNEYHRVIDASLSGPQADLLDVFNGNFLHFWNHSVNAQLVAKSPDPQTVIPAQPPTIPPLHQAEDALQHTADDGKRTIN